MSEELRLVLLTATEKRHRFVAAQLAAHARLVGVVREAKMAAVPDLPSYSAEEKKLIARHFAERDAAEQELLGNPAEIQTNTLEVPAGGINDAAVCRWIETCRPDFVILYGTSIIRPPLLDLYSDRLINIHLGLSPYYRGAATNFWPLVYREPECVGATIHAVVQKVDAGPILTQVRPDWEISDRAHEAGTKALMKAVEILPQVLHAWKGHAIAAVQQDLAGGKVFRRKDFTPEALMKMWSNLDSGMVGEFIANAQPRLRRFPIYEPLSRCEPKMP